VADLKAKGAAALDDAALRALIVQKTLWFENLVTGDKYEILYGTSGKDASTKPLTPTDPGYVTQQFAPNQGQMQLRHVGKRSTLPSLTGDAAQSSYLATTRPYFINSGKIVSELVGTPIEITVYKMGDKYYGARSNEFGYANYQLTPAVAELAPLEGPSKAAVD
jgi:hypothetical protein